VGLEPQTDAVVTRVIPFSLFDLGLDFGPATQLFSANEMLKAELGNG